MLKFLVIALALSSTLSAQAHSQSESETICNYSCVTLGANSEVVSELEIQNTLDKIGEDCSRDNQYLFKSYETYNRPTIIEGSNALSYNRYRNAKILRSYVFATEANSCRSIKVEDIPLVHRR